MFKSGLCGNHHYASLYGTNAGAQRDSMLQGVFMLMKIKEADTVIFPKFRCPQCNLPVLLENAKRTTTTRKERDSMTLEQFREAAYLRCPVCNSILEQIMEASDDLGN